MELLEILKLVKQEMLERKHVYQLDERGPFYIGICAAVQTLRNNNIIAGNDFTLIHSYVKSVTKTRKVFYNCNGEKVSDKNQFVWSPFNIEPRIKWLDKHIKLNSK